MAVKGNLNAMQDSTKSAPREASKLIICMLPDDGSHKALLKALYQEKQITRVEVISCLETGSLGNANAKPGTVADTYMGRMVRVVVPAAEADALFEFICENANMDREGGGVVLQHALVTSTLFSFPEGVAEEET